MNRYVIYKIANTKNGKIYIGKTNNFHKRMIQHKSHSFNKHSMEHERALYQDIRKYGWDAFEKEILYERTPDDKPEEIEMKHIQDAVSNGNSMYNIFGAGENGGVPQGYSKKLAKTARTHKSVLSEEEVKFIRNEYLEGKMPSEVYKLFEDKLSHYYSFMNIWSGSRYGHIMPEVFKIRSNRVKLNYELAEEIRELHQNTDFTYKKIAEMYNVTAATIRDVVQHKTWNKAK